jgi:hypothetical protein
VTLNKESKKTRGGKKAAQNSKTEHPKKKGRVVAWDFPPTPPVGHSHRLFYCVFGRFVTRGVQKRNKKITRNFPQPQPPASSLQRKHLLTCDCDLRRFLFVSHGAPCLWTAPLAETIASAPLCSRLRILFSCRGRGPAVPMASALPTFSVCCWPWPF